MQKKAVVLAGSLLLLIAFTRTAFAQAGTPHVPTDDEVNAIAKQMFCPVCENTPLDVCPTQACEEWRQVIRDKLAQGWSEEQIKQFFVERYGARVLAEPPAQGFNALAYIIPPIAFLAGVFILYRAFRSWKVSQSEVISAEPAPESTEGDEYLERVEEELSEL